MRALFRAVFAVLILIQILLVILLVGLLLSVASVYWPTQEGTSLTLLLFLTPMFVLGFGNYFLYQRLTRAENVGLHAEKWLVERRNSNSGQMNRRKAITRWAVWVPTVTVVLVCATFDEEWAFASDLLHPRSGRLIGYEVSIPLTWTVNLADKYEDAGNVHSTIAAVRYRGLLKAGSGLYVGRRPPFSISTMNFCNVPAGDPLAAKGASEILSTSTLPFGKSSVTCWEEVPPRWMTMERSVHCSTPTGDFSANLRGNNEDEADFSRVIHSIKRSE